MITYNDLIVEAVTPPQRGYSGIKRSEVGQGYGGWLGGGLGGLGASLALAPWAQDYAMQGVQDDIASGEVDPNNYNQIMGSAAKHSLISQLPTVAASALGAYAGGKIGKNVISNPNSPIDEKSRLQRFGAMMAPHASGLASIANVVIPGSGNIGANIYNATKGNAAKLGYGTTGKVFSAITPLAGLTTPKSQQK